MHVQHRRLGPGLLFALALPAAVGCESERDNDVLVVVDAGATGVVLVPDAAAPATSSNAPTDAGSVPASGPTTVDAAGPVRSEMDAASVPPALVQSDSQVARPSDAGVTAQCSALPKSFAVEGCGLPALCHLEQTGCTWQAKCGTKTLVGMASGDVSSFALENGQTCTGTLDAGIFKGTCTGGDAGMCAFRSNTELLPTPFCVELPPQLSSLSVCAQPPAGAQHFAADNCEVIQNGCAFQASCNGGTDVIAGTATATGLRWDTSFGYRCTGTLEGEKVVGTCTQRGVAADAGIPGSCALSATAPAAPKGLDCAEELPTAGFVVKGCALDGTVCHLAQRGCIWQAACGKDVFAGRVREPGVYRFTTPLGATCTARVEGGAFVGRCESTGETCDFGPGTPEPISGCYTVPPAGFTTAGCAGAMTCDVLQSGCKWQASCTTGNGGNLVYAGDSKPNGLTFPGRGEYDCWAYEEAGTNRLVGGCSVAGVEVSECSARVEGGRMVLTPR